MPELFDKFKALAATGLRRMSIIHEEKTQPTEAEVRDARIDNWLDDEDGRLAFIEQLDEWLLMAKDGQRLNLTSHPDLAFFMGHEDALQQVKDRMLRISRGQSNSDPQSR